MTESADNSAGLRQELEKLKADFAALAQDLQSLARTAAGTARRAAAAEGGRLGAEIDETLRDLRQRGDKALEDAKEAVQERPLAALLMALLVGFVLARLLDRR
jgi:ElaB/YqjD/DUF883 family membrane-anchored ribosome-binding protein